MASDISCIFNCNDISGKVQKFTEENLQQCRDQLCVRVASFKAPCVHIVFDRYFEPSIKDYERSLRGGSTSNHEYIISGAEQTRSHDFAKELRNDKFKEALVNFLIDHWQSNDLAPFIDKKTIILNFKQCYSYSVNAKGEVVREKNFDFFCPAHEEADTKIVFHASKVNENKTVVVKCSDTDIVVIMLGNLHKIKAKVYIDCGVSNTRHIIDVNALHELLGLDLCKALPGFHAFTGCDYNPAFFRKGKQRPFQILQKKEDFKKAFASLGDSSIVTDDNINKLESFLCTIYGYEYNNKINNVRFHMFLKNYKVKTNTEAFLKKNLKNFDSSCLPPCYNELEQQIKRANYIAHVWKNATEFDGIQFEAEESGWILHENKYDFDWFKGQQLPSSVEDIIMESDNSEGKY